MTPEEFQRVDEVFQTAVALPEEERSRYLHDCCRDEPRIRAEVQTLLARDAAPHRLLAFEPREPPVPRDDVPTPAYVGPYRILDVLGTGAMGVVYRAEQENPRRLVALKLMRAGFSSAQALRRFRREAELLGRLQHPGVAHVIEAGTTSSDGGGVSQPYFVMELVDGRQLMDHVRHHELSVRARTELMVRICEAVEHAHLSGIVHRDLKPANILVTEGDTTSSRLTRDAAVIGQPKILDFGVARIMDADRIAASVQTSAGELVGTLPYMSPEQIAGDQDAVDTRCDVYALGVLLFEMFTGRRPHDVSGKSLAEAARIICDEPPTPLRAVERKLRGDLDTIVTTATAKDVARRYPSVGMLAADLRRHLADEPILARPPTTIYQLRKFARRNRGLVTGIVTAVLVLVFALITSAALYTRAERRAELMRRALYAQRITLGQNALESGDAREVAALLDACPVDLRHWEWRRLRFLTDRSERTLRGHTGRVNDIVFGPDCNIVVTAGGYDETTPIDERERSARVWDANDGTLLRIIADDGNPVQSAAISPDGRTLATLTRMHDRVREARDGWLRLWNLEDAALLGEIPVHPTMACGLCFTGDGSGLLVGGGLGRIARVDVAEAELVWSHGVSTHTTGLALTPDGADVVVSHWNGIVSLLDAHTGELRWSREPHGIMVLRSVAVSPDGALIATGSKDRTIKLLDRRTGAVLRTLPDIGTAVAATAFTTDGRLLAGGADGVIRFFDPETGVLEGVLLGHEDAVLRMSVSPDGLRLASASGDGTAKLWRLDAPPPDLLQRPHGAVEVNDAAWNPQGTAIATAGDDGHVRVIDVGTGTLAMTLPHVGQYVHSVDWSSDGTRLASVDSSGGMRLWDARTGAPLAMWQGHDVWSSTTRFSPDGHLLATGARGQLKIWDGWNGTLVHELEPGATDVIALAWSPDSAVLAHSGTDGILTVWDASSGARISSRPGLDVSLDALAFHPNGAWIACGDDSGAVRMLEWASDRELYTVNLHAGTCETIAFSPDGARMLTGGFDGWMRLVEARTGEHVMTMKEHRSGVLSAVFSPDGRRIASTSRDHTLRIWNAAAPELSSSPRP